MARRRLRPHPAAPAALFAALLLGGGGMGMWLDGRARPSSASLFSDLKPLHPDALPDSPSRLPRVALPARLLPEARPSFRDPAPAPENPALHTAPGDAPPPFESTAETRRPIVRFNGRDLAAQARAGAELAAFQSRLGPGTSAVALVGIRARAGPALREAFLTEGVDLLEYVPEDGWIARVHGRAELPRPEGRVFCFRPLDDTLRVPPGAWPLPLHASEVLLRVHLVADRSAHDVQEALAAAGFAGFTVSRVGPRSTLAGTVPSRRWALFLEQAARHPDTLCLEPAGRARLLNNRARATTQSGAHPGTTPVSDRGLSGEGQMIAICDTGLDADSCYFREPGGTWPPVNRLAGSSVDLTRRKVVAVSFLDAADDPADPRAWDDHGHGTAVAGTAAGATLWASAAAAEDPGMAPGARLIIQDAGYRASDGIAELPGLGSPVTNFFPALVQALSLGATIHNNSWSEDASDLEPNRYTQICRELDFITWTHKPFLVVAAAGNHGLHGSVVSPSTAKNGLSVAASLSGEDFERVATYSSRGWASDGRFKPDLAAPGDFLRTAAGDGDLTTDNCHRAYRSGTSLAAPVVTGLAALIRDYFAQGFHPTGDPVPAHRRPEVSAALVKAVLLNATVPMARAAGPPPSRDQGWGRVNLSRTLKLSPAGPALLAVDEAVGFAAAPAWPYRRVLRVLSPNLPLKVTLVWSDYPATPGADRHLVNDLDLRLRTPALTLKGNVFQGGRSVSGGEYDRLNNVEQIEWTPPEPGLVEVSVWAHRIVVGPQDFALVAAGDFEEVPLDTDADSDGLPDFWEEWHFGDLSASPGEDPDGDGASNRTEFLANTDPRAPGSCARIEFAGLDQGVAQFEVQAGEAREYTLERALGTPLAAAAWTAVGATVRVGDPVGEVRLRLTDPTALPPPDQTPRYYRVRIGGGVRPRRYSGRSGRGRPPR